MKKIILTTFFLSIFFGFSNVSFALSDVGWYGPTDRSSNSACPSDLTGEYPNIDFDPTMPLDQKRDFAIDVDGDGYLTSADYVSTQTTQKVGTPTTSKKCFKWDGVSPTTTMSLTTPSGTRTNQDVTATVSCNDNGGSGCDVSTYQYGYVTSPTSPCTGATGWTTGTSITFNTDSITYICSRVKDKAGNGYSYSPVVYTIKIDKTAPVAGNITSNPVNNSDLLAKSNSLIIINSNDTTGGSPINLIQGYFEKASTCNDTFGTVLDRLSSNSSTLNHNADYSKVQASCSGYANGRVQYTYKITYVQDEAGNSIGVLNAGPTYAGVISFNYNVYADTTNITTRSFGLNQVININSGNGIANGSSYPLTITLKDTYGNPIVPATGIGRTIDFNYDVVNTSRLDQYNVSGDAVYLSIPNNISLYGNYLPSGTINFNSQPSTYPTNGEYNFDFKIYAPINYLPTSYGLFSINSINFDVNGTLGDSNNNLIPTSNIPFSFKPIYETTINSPVTTDGFMIQATQTGTISVTKNSGTVSNSRLYLEFGSGGTSSDSPEISPKFNMKLTSPNKQISGPSGNNEGYGYYVDYGTFIIGNNDLNTYMTQSGSADNTAGQYLSSHIGYKIADPNGGLDLDVLYNGDILGKTNYWASPSGIPINTNQGLKIGGIVSSQNQTDITTDQGVNDLHIVGNISKTILKKDMRENVYNLINQVTPNNGGNKITDLNGDGAKTEIWYNSDGKKTLSDKVLYFNGEDVTLDSGDTLTGKKTIIVVGGNLYIKSNVVNDPTGSNILGIIVLKDDNGDGGNLYIDPDVTRIDAVIYTDKSLISYDGTKELDGETLQAVLANQLYINGSVFSENTIGGSIKTPPVCPYYVKNTDCDLKTAQKYDLNFLRRYYVGATGPIYGGLSVLDPTDPNYKYPIVIKYNPQIQSDPPPLFGN